MLFPVCGRVATCLNYLTTIIFQVAVETISYSSGSSNDKCLWNLLCYGNSSCVQHCIVIAGSRCPAVSLHVILQLYKVMYWMSLSKSCTKHYNSAMLQIWRNHRLHTIQQIHASKMFSHIDLHKGFYFEHFTVFSELKRQRQREVICYQLEFGKITLPACHLFFS